MWKPMILGAAWLLLVSSWVAAADKEIHGKVVRVSTDAKTITVQLDENKQFYTLSVNEQTKLLDEKGMPLREGLANKRLLGAHIKAVQAADKQVKSVQLEEEKPGVPAKITKIDLEKQLLTVEMDGKKTELKIGDEVQFIGPRGGVSEKGLKDDRVAVGAEVRIVFDGKKQVKEIHLPVRQSDK